jgi:membrane associated rhomboid family serine protease
MPSPGAAAEGGAVEAAQRQHQRQQRREADVERGQREEGEEEDDGYDDDDDTYEDGYDEEYEGDDNDADRRSSSHRRRSSRGLKRAPADGDDGDARSSSSSSSYEEEDDEEAARDTRRSHAATTPAAAAPTTTRPSSNSISGRPNDNPPPPPPPPARVSLVPVRRSVAEAFLVPDGRIKYWPAFTLTATVMFVGVFAFMAGGYGGYLAQEQQRRLGAGAAATNATTPATEPPPLLLDPPQPAWWATPRNMGSWLAFWRPTPQTTFAWPYLAAWGGRYAPALLKRRGGWRVVASLGLHASAAHLASNLLVFLLLSAHLEHSYGPLRVGLAFFAACIGGTFLSLAFEDPCALYVGASGGVYGLVGLYVLSIAVNHETMPLWWLRLGSMVASICFMIVVSAVGPGPKGGSAGDDAAASAAPPPARNGTSHLSHLGGFLTGLLAAFLFLPNFKDRRWRAARRVAKRLGRALPGIKSGSGNGGGGDGSTNGGGLLAATASAPSCWRVRRPLFRAVAALSVSSVVFLMVALPVYAWTSLLPGLSCPDEDALLASIDAPA